MTDVLILGTDTDQGKTALALLWLAARFDDYEYWKPLETGESDSQRVRRCVPETYVHQPLGQFELAVAPLLAARQQGHAIPRAHDIAVARPGPKVPGRHLLIETFGSPLSPLNETELQIVLIQALAIPAVLVCSSTVGAIGRTLQCLNALQGHGVRPDAVILMGRPDAFAVEQLDRHWPRGSLFCLQLPFSWDAEGVARAAHEQASVLQALHSRLSGDDGVPTRRRENRPWSRAQSLRVFAGAHRGYPRARSAFRLASLYLATRSRPSPGRRGRRRRIPMAG